MRWTRRNFLQAAGGLAAVTGLGLLAKNIIETDSPESKYVDLVARYEGKTQTLGTLKGAHSLEIEIPFVSTSEESYNLTAVVYDSTGAFESEPVEVLAQPFSFGL